MVVSSDILLKGTAWNVVIDTFSNIFKTRTNYSIYLLALSIGVVYDQRIEKLEEAGDDVRNVPRNVIANNDGGMLDYLFGAAILSTTTEDLAEERRLELAFGDKNTDFNKIAFLTQFANFGVTKLMELIGDTDEESMENIKNFLARTFEGENFDIDDIPDDYILDDIDLA